MPFRPPLTRQQLHDIGQRRAGEDVPALLWEIARLRAHVLRADQLIRSMPQGSSENGGTGLILRLLRDELTGEPCILERPVIGGGSD